MKDVRHWGNFLLVFIHGGFNVRFQGNIRLVFIDETFGVKRGVGIGDKMMGAKDVIIVLLASISEYHDLTAGRAVINLRKVAKRLF